MLSPGELAPYCWIHIRLEVTSDNIPFMPHIKIYGSVSSWTYFRRSVRFRRFTIGLCLHVSTLVLIPKLLISQYTPCFFLSLTLSMPDFFQEKKKDEFFCLCISTVTYIIHYSKAKSEYFIIPKDDSLGFI